VTILRQRPPAPTGLQECRLYRFWGDDGLLLYVGETARQPFTRMMEHVADQPWSDLIVAWERDPQVFAGKGEVLAAEERAVKVERPLHNHEYNLRNPARVPIPVARRQRAVRDAARGGSAPAWGPPAAGARPVQRRSRPARRPSWWRTAWRQRRRIAAGVVWLGLAGTAWSALEAEPVSERWWMSAGLASVVLVVVRARRRKRRR
jgi:hypothetical protein